MTPSSIRLRKRILAVEHAAEERLRRLSRTGQLSCPCVQAHERPVRSSVRRADRSSACATTSATRAAARIPGCGGSRRCCGSSARDLGFVPLVIGASTRPVRADAARVRAASCRSSAAGCPFSRRARRALLLFGASGAIPVFDLGSWWTVLSATWLHGSLLHILFNMMWVRDLGPATADIIGPARTVIIYVVSGVCGFLLSSVAGRVLPAACRSCGGAELHGRRVGVDLRPARRAGALRPQERQQPDSRTGEAATRSSCSSSA